MPARANATLLTRAAFVLSIAGTGALIGWRERRGRALDGDRDISTLPRWIIAGILLALLAAYLAYHAAHG